MKAADTRTQRGFTLLELAVVLTIIAIVIGMSANMGISVIATARLAATQNKMAAIDKAMMAYRTANDRIPCPADLTLASGKANYGMEAANPGVCGGGTPAANFFATTGVAEGAVPTATLSMPGDFMYDGWGNHFRYAVDVSMTIAGAFPDAPLNYVSCSPIRVNDSFGNSRTTTAIYALISHGANGHGAYSSSGAVVSANSDYADELTNCHCDSTGANTGYSLPTYVQRSNYQTPADPNGGFDDLVTYKMRWQMMPPWDTGGVTASALDVVAATYYDGGPDPIYFYTIDPCGGVTGTLVTPGVGIYGLAYSHDNSLLYIPAAYTNGHIFTVNASGIATTDTGVAIPNPDGGSHADPVVSPDGQYLAMTTGGFPTMPIWKTTAGPAITSLVGVNIAPYYTQYYQSVAFDPSDTHMAVGMGGASLAAPNPTIYKRSGDTFTALVGQPDQSLTSSVPYNLNYAHEQVPSAGPVRLMQSASE
jgi:prepilin-type N-terminal cleavage/methylation domain-containing protein